MTVIRTFTSLGIPSLVDKNLVIAIGIFDGVHIGHRYLIERAKNLARVLSSECAVYTFWPYPHHVDDKKEKKILYSIDHKYDVLHELGVKYIIEQVFNENFSQLRADKFMEYLLLQIPLLRGICVGQDFQFGYSRSGDVDTLHKLCREHHICCQVVNNLIIHDQVVSSTYIRQLVAENNFQLANTLVCDEYFH